jgi:UDP-glucose 4-epimerase
LKVLITGGAGFIGSNIADLLLENGHEVVAIIDDLSTGKRQNIPKDAYFMKQTSGTSLYRRYLQKKDPNVLIHHAAQVSVRISTQDPVLDAHINILGSINLLEAAVKHNVKKVLFASSGGTVYGEQKVFPADEDHVNLPISPYGAAKFAVEKYIYYYHVNYGLQFINLRYANIYGPRQDPYGEAGVVAIFSQKIIKGHSPTSMETESRPGTMSMSKTPQGQTFWRWIAHITAISISAQA